MIAHLFSALCETLGYEPDSVMSVRVNPHMVVITHIDSSGMLGSTTHLLSATRAVPPSQHAEASERQAWQAGERAPHPPADAV
jgi:hypothetical protein